MMSETILIHSKYHSNGYQILSWRRR